MLKLCRYFIILFVFIVNSYSQENNPEKNLFFEPQEVESMLFLYNQTTIKGADVDMVAPLGAKLKAGLKEARTQKDTTKTIILKVTPTELQICLNIIENSSFEAKYAELVAGMKRKLLSLLPAPPPAQEEE